MKKLLERSAALALCLMLTFSIIACSPSQSSNGDATQSSSTTTESATISYPLTVTDHLGRSVTIEKEPEKIVSGYYITTSLCIGLGLEAKLVGVEAKASSRHIYSLADGASRILELPNVGTAKAFDLEGCAALNPDLVILPVKLKEAVTSLEQLGITVIAVNPEDQELLFETIDMISSASNKASEGISIKNYIEHSLSDLSEKLAGSIKPSVYLAGNSSILETAGPAMYQNSMIENAGGTNCAASISDTYWANVSYEQVLTWNPSYIFIAADASYSVDDVLADANLAACDAVKNKQVYQIPNQIESLDSPVPASFLASSYMASKLHSNLVTDDSYKNLTTEFYKTFYGFTPELNEK